MSVGAKLSNKKDRKDHQGYRFKKPMYPNGGSSDFNLGNNHVCLEEDKSVKGWDTANNLSKTLTF